MLEFCLISILTPPIKTQNSTRKLVLNIEFYASYVLGTGMNVFIYDHNQSLKISQ